VRSGRRQSGAKAAGGGAGAGGGGGAGSKPAVSKLGEQQRALLLGLSDGEFDAMANMLEPRDRQELRQARFLAKESLGELSSVKCIKSAQVHADSKARQLANAQELLVKRRAAAESALLAMREQELRVEALRKELDEAVGKAKQVLADGDADIVPEPKQVVGEYALLASAVADALSGAMLGAAADPLHRLLGKIAADAKAIPREAPDCHGAAAGGEGVEAGVREDEHATEDDEDDSMGSVFSPDSWKAFNESFCEGDAEKRKWVEELQSKMAAHRAADKRQRTG
jgi:hypothetical protein